MTEREIWKDLKSSFSYSHIKCFICDERMYYGKETMITTGQKAIFKCRCPDKAIIHNQCATCLRPVTYENQQEHAFRFRCSCGHNDIVLVKNIDDTVKV